MDLELMTEKDFNAEGLLGSARANAEHKHLRAAWKAGLMNRTVDAQHIKDLLAQLDAATADDAQRRIHRLLTFYERYQTFTFDLYSTLQDLGAMAPPASSARTTDEEIREIRRVENSILGLVRDLKRNADTNETLKLQLARSEAETTVERHAHDITKDRLSGLLRAHIAALQAFVNEDV